MTKTTTLLRTLGLLGLAALASLGAAAQTTLHFREGQRVDPEAVRQILDQPATRSIRLLGEAADAGAPQPPAALSLPVQFEFDSAAILPEAREQLDALVQGIRLLPPGRRVVIEGHTDAAGGDDYNQQLSRRRAAAVKLYLVQQGIAERRLQDTGVGKRQPVAGSDPFAAENRRVEFRGG